MHSRRRTLGQHFLVDAGAVARIVGALDPREGEPILEIGPGRGVLTEALLGATRRMAAVEIDEALGDLLERRFAAERLVVLRGDVLRTPFSAVLAALGADGGRLAIAGNLPYSISKPVVQKLVAERDTVDRAVLMFQREVARRLTAKPGSRDYGPLGLLAGRVYEIRGLFDLKPRAFRPAPSVDSTVTVWARRPGPPLTADEEARLRACLAACFHSRRRTLRNNLRGALGDDQRVERLLSATGTDGERRAEELAPEVFAHLAAAWSAGP